MTPDEAIEAAELVEAETRYLHQLAREAYAGRARRRLPRRIPASRRRPGRPVEPGRPRHRRPRPRRA